MVTRLWGAALIFLGTVTSADSRGADSDGSISFDSKEHRTSADLSQGYVLWDCGFSNDGTKDIRILNVETSCGCMVAELQKTQYRPGERGALAIVMRFGTSSTIENTQVIKVMTDEPQIYELTLVAQFRGLVDVVPRMLIWNAGSSESKTVTVNFHTRDDVEIVGFSGNEKGLLLVKINEGKQQGEYSVAITPKPDSKRVRVTLKPIFSSHEDIPNAEVYVVIR